MMRQKPFFVRHGGQMPEDAVEIASWTDDVVRFFPAGGGLERNLSTDEFDRQFRRVAAAELASIAYRRGTFDIDGIFGDQLGFTKERRWNGWACPMFPFESCMTIISKLPGARFDPCREAFVIPREHADPGDESEDVYLHQTIVVEGQEIQVWGIGSCSWTWDEALREADKPQANE